MITHRPIAGAIHMHSDYSHDGLDSFEQLREACIARRIRFVGMTDHAEDMTPEVFPEYVAHCASVSDELVRFIPGLEFKFAGYKGIHLLALGLREWISPRTPEEFFEQTATAAQLTVLAHPVLAVLAGTRIPQIVLDRIGGIEVWNPNYNTRYLPDPNAIALVHAVRQHRPEVVATVGLDQHDSRNDRETRSLIATADMGDPLAALAAGRFINKGRSVAFDAHATLTPSYRRWLGVARPVLDAVNRAHDRTLFTLRRLGIR